MNTQYELLSLREEFEFMEERIDGMEERIDLYKQKVEILQNKIELQHDLLGIYAKMIDWQTSAIALSWFLFVLVLSTIAAIAIF